MTNINMEIIFNMRRHFRFGLNHRSIVNHHSIKIKSHCQFLWQRINVFIFTFAMAKFLLVVRSIILCRFSFSRNKFLRFLISFQLVSFSFKYRRHLMKKMFVRFAICFCLIFVEVQSDVYRFVLLSDLHIGDTQANAVGRARSAVTKINQLAANRSNNLQAVFITGDLTNSATISQYETVVEILNELTIPFYPIIGNHDQWSYNSTWEDTKPVGDQLFAKTFKQILQRTEIINYSNSTVWNPTDSCQSLFQNYRLTIFNNVIENRIRISFNSSTIELF